MTVYHSENPPPDRILTAFLIESLGIEGIHREPTKEEMDATREFLCAFSVTVDSLCALQAVYAPGMPLRTQKGMDVRVGRYVAPPGGPTILRKLKAILAKSTHPYKSHLDFESLHPFCDGNGRTGRALWAWQMNAQGMSAFALPFLHRFYYQTLEHEASRT